MKLIKFKHNRNILNNYYRFYNEVSYNTQIITDKFSNKYVNNSFTNTNKYYFSTFNNNFVKFNFSKKHKNHNHKHEHNHEEDEEEVAPYEVDLDEIEGHFKNEHNELVKIISKQKFGVLNLEEINNLKLTVHNKKQELSGLCQVTPKGYQSCSLTVYDASNITHIYKALQTLSSDYQIKLENNTITISLVGANTKEKKQEFIKGIKKYFDESKHNLQNIRAEELKTIRKHEKHIEKDIKKKLEKMVEDLYKKYHKLNEDLHKKKEQEVNN